MTYKIGALTISQSPRYDLLAPLQATFPHNEIIEIGALDAIDTSRLPDSRGAYYPLTTTCKDGTLVTLDRDFLAPLLQIALTNLESQHVDVSILLCAGDFPNLQAQHPLIKPTQTAQKILRAMGMNRLAIISPIVIQNQPIADKWRQAGFDATVWTMPLDTTPTQQADWINKQVEKQPDVGCVVLDYVGYPSQSTLTLQTLVKKPLLELGHLAISTLAAGFGR